MSKQIGVLGYGEVGQAIAKFYGSAGSPQAKIKDLNKDDGLKGVEILHICIPFNKKFIEVVSKEIKSIKPKLAIIHSTIAPGTTKKLIFRTGNKMIVHSPVRGIHPHLHKGIKTFVKFIGAENKKAGKMAKKHLSSLGIKTEVFYPAITTEALKLWDTTQYAWMIVLNKAIKEWCDKNNLDFDAIYTKANKTYNEGYLKLKRSEVVRPYLKYMPGKIGGHCVIPNCHLLNSKIAKFILKKNWSYKK